MIGVFDSGSGGLTILSALHKTIANEDFLYLGDHARNPYGEQSQEQIISMSKEMVEALFAKGCSLVILACNTASTIALRHLQENWLQDAHPNKRVLGVHIPVVEALTGLQWERDGHNKNLNHSGGAVVVFATSKTVASGTYSRQVKLRAPNYNIIEQACPKLASAIENGQDNKATNLLIKNYVEEALGKCDETPNAVILGCTHYPLVEDMFKQHLPNGIEILNQPQLVAKSLKTYLEKHPNMRSSKPTGQTLYLTTGKPDEIASFDVKNLKSTPKFSKL